MSKTAHSLVRNVPHNAYIDRLYFCPLFQLSLDFWAVLDHVAAGRFAHIENLWFVSVRGPFWYHRPSSYISDVITDTDDVITQR